MREFRFRAWDLKNKSWYFQDKDIFNMEDECGTMCIAYKDYVIMQYTGLHDKNGKEIWEGDVVKLPGMNPKLVFFEPNTASFRIGTESNQNPLSTHQMTLSVGYWEVLGNIYENPELLEVK